MRVLVDTNNLCVKAYYGVKGTEKEEGDFWVGWEVINMLRNMNEHGLPLLDCGPMDDIVCCFDGGNSRRREIYPYYKTHRKEQPEDLHPQIEMTRKLLREKGFSVVMVPDYEADDVVSLLASCYTGETVIVSSDRDLLVNVGNKVSMLLLRYSKAQGSYYHPINNRNDVAEVIGVFPEQIPDMKGLGGDVSDGIPGVSGVGEGIAAKLISKYGTIENVLAHIGELVTTKGKAMKIALNISEQVETAFLSRRLAQPILPNMSDIPSLVHGLPEVLQ